VLAALSTLVVIRRRSRSGMEAPGCAGGGTAGAQSATLLNSPNASFVVAVDNAHAQEVKALEETRVAAGRQSLTAARLNSPRYISTSASVVVDVDHAHAQRVKALKEKRIALLNETKAWGKKHNLSLDDVTSTTEAIKRIRRQIEALEAELAELSGSEGVLFERSISRFLATEDNFSV